MTMVQAAIKRAFDALLAVIALVVLLLAILLVALVVKLFSRGPALFRQDRIGRGGKLFRVVKFRTMRVRDEVDSPVTVRNDERVTGIGRFLRRFKLDEMPQVWNVLVGNMSFVGPRPDVPGYADRLQGAEREILALRPGITGPATLFFRNEEELLARTSDPQKYNDEVIYPLKVQLNLEYARNWSFWRDIGYVLVTVCPPLDRWLKVVPRGVELPRPEEYR